MMNTNLTWKCEDDFSYWSHEDVKEAREFLTHIELLKSHAEYINDKYFGHMDDSHMAHDIIGVIDDFKSDYIPTADLLNEIESFVDQYND